MLRCGQRRKTVLRTDRRDKSGVGGRIGMNRALTGVFLLLALLAMAAIILDRMDIISISKDEPAATASTDTPSEANGPIDKTVGAPESAPPDSASPAESAPIDTSAYTRLAASWDVPPTPVVIDMTPPEPETPAEPAPEAVPEQAAQPEVTPAQQNPPAEEATHTEAAPAEEAAHQEQPPAAPAPASGPNSLSLLKVGFSGNDVVLHIQAVQPIASYKTLVLVSPGKVVIDLDGAYKKPAEPDVPKNNVIKKVRVGVHADMLRIVADLHFDSEAKYTVEEISPSQLAITITK